MARKRKYHWRDVAPIVGGKCTKHKTKVGKVTSRCYECHVEHMKEAGHTYDEEGNRE